jgi:hypothetical protein
VATETLELDAAARIAAPGAVDAARRLLGLSHEPLAGAALSRAMNALAEIASELDRHSLGEAAGARSDTAALLRILEDPAALARLQQTDPLADARLRWVRDRERLLHAEGEPLTSAAVGQLLGVSRQAVAKARAEGRLLGLPTGRGTYVYPSWQFGRSGVLHGFRRMREAFASAQGRAVGHDDPWLLATFMVSPNSRLNDESPLAVLQRGRQEDVEAAVCTAAAWGEQSAA